MHQQWATATPQPAKPCFGQTINVPTVISVFYDRSATRRSRCRKHSYMQLPPATAVLPLSSALLAKQHESQTEVDSIYLWTNGTE